MRSSFAYLHFPEISIMVKSTNNFNFSASNNIAVLLYILLQLLCDKNHPL